MRFIQQKTLNSSVAASARSTSNSSQQLVDSLDIGNDNDEQDGHDGRIQEFYENIVWSAVESEKIWHFPFTVKYTEINVEIKV